MGNDTAFHLSFIFNGTPHKPGTLRGRYCMSPSMQTHGGPLTSTSPSSSSWVSSSATSTFPVPPWTQSAATTTITSAATTRTAVSFSATTESSSSNHKILTNTVTYAPGNAAAARSLRVQPSAARSPYLHASSRHLPNSSGRSAASSVALTSQGAGQTLSHGDTMATCFEALPGSSMETVDSQHHRQTSPEKPCRNLSQAFEALCVDTVAGENNDGSGSNETVKKASFPKDVISPTGVHEIPMTISSSGYSNNEASFPFLALHTDLKRDLTDALVQRVSIYSIIHDINKEATTMALHDPLNVASNHSSATAANDDDSPLVQAALSKPTTPRTSTPTAVPTITILDEEAWLLDAIQNRTGEYNGIAKACPETFLQAMGEQEYQNQTRTQLWKPSRSWWEAKSGKNPWIEPSSHNKRWRYLWPLIHYHKFLHKCIKKLKRNSVDVKLSVSPVAVFLREEVCAVSDHLASVSLFGSDEWMNCLHHFNGWIIFTSEAEDAYMVFVRALSLRSLQEPGDVDSPLLRSQIDEHFLRSMAAQREQMRDAVPEPKKVTARKPMIGQGGPPPIYPRPQESVSQAPNPQVPKQIHGVRRPRFYPPPHSGWWNPAWDAQQQLAAVPAAPALGDSSSVQSGLSTDSYPQPHDFSQHPYYNNMYMTQHYDLAAAQQVTFEAVDNAKFPAGYHFNGMDPRMYDPQGAWVDPMAVAYAMHMHHGHLDPYFPPGTPTAPPSPAVAQAPMDMQSPPADEATDSSTETPYALPPENTMATSAATNHSPYWAHLDQATLAMGLATPAQSTPSTPARKDKRDDAEVAWTTVAAAPFLRPHYYGYGAYGARDGYAPPSPATQFMMSPQPNFAYNYGYGFSPRRPLNRSAPRNPRRHSDKSSPLASSSTPSIAERKVSVNNSPQRESPSTVDTTTETESTPDPVH